MTTLSLLERAGRLSDEIRAEAEKVDPVKVAFTLLMVPFVVVGFLLGLLFRGVVLVLAFAVISGRVGYKAASGPDLAGTLAKLRKPAGS